MAADPDDPNPTDQLIELLVYAPIGLLYEYEEVLPKLIKRGKSQVQLARVLGRLAVNRQGGVEGALGEAAMLASSALARAVTEVGSMIGLAPEDDRAGSESSASESGAEPDPQAEAPEVSRSTVDADAPTGTTGAESDLGRAGAPAPLPIAGYDDLTAREIVPLLDDLTVAERRRIEEHERAGRARKTVLGKLERLQRLDG